MQAFSDGKVTARILTLRGGRREDGCGVQLKDCTLFGEAWGRNGFTYIGQLGFVFSTVTGFRKLSTLPMCANLGYILSSEAVETP